MRNFRYLKLVLSVFMLFGVLVFGNNIQITSAEESRLSGYSVKQPLLVYQNPSRNSVVLKQYNFNSKLKYQSYSDNWYTATVYLNGIAHKGYIHKDDVSDGMYTKNIYGIANNNLKVYEEPKVKSRELKGYKQGSILKFRNYNDDWYIATVFLSGKSYQGYIRHTDIELTESVQTGLTGIGIKNKTKVYSRASTSSKSLKGYNEGHILKFRTFSKNWYEATVYIKGKRHTGYIHHKDVELTESNQVSLKGLGIKHKTKVYSRASKKSKPLKSYDYGSNLRFRTFSKNWYEATVYIKGKRHTGYIHKNDIADQLGKQLSGYAQKEITNVYSSTSTNSKVLKSYKYGSQLKYRYYNANWYIATVYVKGKKHTGFIRVSDTGSSVKKHEGYALKDKTHVYSEANRNSKVLKSYKKGSLMKYLPHNDSWYKAVVYVKGKKHSGFIHVDDMGDKVAEIEKPSEPIKLPILMYHQVGDNPGSHQLGQFVTEDNFREQMVYLKESGYTLINFEDISNIENIEKPIIVTFDDGRENNMLAYEVLSDLQDDNFKPSATFFAIVNRIGTQGYLTSEQLKELSDSNIISIQSHTWNHKHFNDSQVEVDLIEELVESKQYFEELTNKEVTAIAYPYGAVNNEVLEIVKEHYDYAVTVRYGVASMEGSMHELDRVRISFDTNIEQFKKMIEGK